jgi:hypothetical protein
VHFEPLFDPLWKPISVSYSVANGSAPNSSAESSGRRSKGGERSNSGAKVRGRFPSALLLPPEPDADVEVPYGRRYEREETTWATPSRRHQAPLLLA